MKTLKTTLLILAISIANTTFSQSKEETKEWLNNNGSTLLNTGKYKDDEGSYYLDRFEKIENDTLKYFSFFYCEKCTPAQRQLTFHIPIKSILYEDVNTLVKKKSIIGYFTVRLIPGTIVTYTGSDKGSDTVDFKNFYYQPNDEENAKRVIKAIMHLAKLSGAKENKQIF